MLRRLRPFKNYYVKLVAKFQAEPTEIVNKLIVEFFPDIVNVTFSDGSKLSMMS